MIRFGLNCLNCNDFLNLWGDPNVVLPVRIGKQNFVDGQIGYDPIYPPFDQQIREWVDLYGSICKASDNF